jgi:biotin synthase-like enzyme
MRQVIYAYRIVINTLRVLFHLTLIQEESLAVGRPEVVLRLQHCSPLSSHPNVNPLDQLKTVETVLYHLVFPQLEIILSDLIL